MKKWWKEAVVYQIYPRSFMDSNGDGIGDLKGIASKLDYLQALGIDVIWICPMYQSPNDDNGYDISNYQAIMAEFGTMADFDELLQEVHKRGMKLILDLVINHTSDEHPWFIESRSSKDHPKRDWYIWRDGKEGRPPNNWESIFSGSAWEYDPETDQYYMHLFSKKQPDLNWENPDVREELHKMMNWWMEKGIDGFRVDAISHIKKTPGLPDMDNPQLAEVVPCFPHTTNVQGIDEWLRELKEKTLDQHDVITVGEANGVGLHDAEKWVGEKDGYFNMIFNFEHLELWKKGVDQTLDLPALRETLSKWQHGLEGVGWNALFLENHDQPRSVSAWGNDGEYLTESAKALAAMYFLMQGTPYIYQGQEIGMTNVQFPNIEDYDDVGMKNFYDIEVGKGKNPQEIMEIIWKNGRDNSRTPMQWTSGQHAGFSQAEHTWLKVNPNYVSINVENQQSDPNSVWHFYKNMIQLRKEHEVFVYGLYNLILMYHSHVFAYTRTLGNQKALVISNLFAEETVFTLPEDLAAHQDATLLLHNYPIEKERASLGCHTLKPYETRVYLLTF